MKNVVPGSELLLAPPGTEHLSYNFPAKAGGLYAVPSQSNLYPWLLMFAMLLLLNITIGGGGLPKWKLATAFFMEPYVWLRGKLSRSK